MTVDRPQPPASGSTGESALRRFERSMVMDYERWHDGTGYDLEALQSASAEECRQIESLLVSRGARDWRDVEALAALGTTRATSVLQKVLKGPDTALALAAARHAPELSSDEELAALMVAVIGNPQNEDGLTAALLEAERLHPPAVVDALLRGTLERDGATAMQFAALLLFVHGKADSPYDWAQRPFLLEFATEDRAAREAAHHRLRTLLGMC